ncbi:hypothetical protein GCM10010343_36550 [Streptomyces avidinii]|nr:hypothetical protein GCM10010343_36550 [Streptomyces avidinii]
MGAAGSGECEDCDTEDGNRADVAKLHVNPVGMSVYERPDLMGACHFNRGWAPLIHRHGRTPVAVPETVPVAWAAIAE